MTDEKRSDIADFASRFKLAGVHIEAWVRGDSSVARTADGSVEVVVHAMTAHGKGFDKLNAGVDIVLNGGRVGQLRQPTRRIWPRSSRAILLEWDSPERFPQHAYFRARGPSGDPSLETASERICTYRFGRQNVHPDVGVEVLCLWANMRYGLSEAVQF